KCNPNRHTLGQPHPTEGGVDVGKQVGAALSLPVCDAAGNALYVALDYGALANQVDTGRIADLDARQLGLLEITIDVKAIAVDQGEQWLPRVDIIARPHIEIGDEAVDRRAHRGPSQIECGNIATGESLLVCRLRFHGGGAALLLLLLRDGQRIEP